MEHTTSEQVTPVDNYSNVLRQVIEFVLKNAPEGLRPHDRKSLERQLEQPAEELRSYISIEFEREDATCRACASLYVSFDSRWSERFEDAEGNQWREYKLEVSTNWPSFGGASPKVQMIRLGLMGAVTAFAQDIIDLFPGPYHGMVASAAQIAAEKEARESEFAKMRVKTLVLQNRTKMRVGQERMLELASNEAFQALPVASWEVPTEDGKSYKFEKTGTHGAYITRNS
jgi:hypothetical protein